jgi:hypothetical protein
LVYFPLPRLECVFDAIGAAKATVFSVVDLASGFWQIPMDPATRQKAAYHQHSIEKVSNLLLRVLVP